MSKGTFSDNVAHKHSLSKAITFAVYSEDLQRRSTCDNSEIIFLISL